MPSPTTSPRDVILHRRSTVHNKRPLTTDIQYGELAVAYNQQDPAIYLKDLQNKIRKVGGVYYSENAPDPTQIPAGYQGLSHGEIWIKKTGSGGDLNTAAEIWIWNENLNSGAGDWVHVGIGTFGILDDYLDQFKDATDGSDYIHTDRNRLKINNKTALRGYATTIPSDDETDTTKANTLVINDAHNFATGVTLNANNLVIDSSDIDITADTVTFNSETAYTLQTDSVTGTAESVFTYNDHGFFNGESVIVLSTLSDSSPSPITAGEYTIAEATLNTFKLYDGANNVLSTGNVRLNYFPQLLLDRDYNVVQSGNFKVKGLEDAPDDSQIADGTWDIYRNPTSGNVRVYARAGNDIEEVPASAVTLEIKNNGTGAIAKGDPVCFTGIDPIKKVIVVEKADASDPTKMKAIGLANKAVASGGFGTITVLGDLRGVDTSSLDGATSGDDSGKVVYVGVGGGLTLTPVLSSDGERQAIGILAKEDASEGRILVNHPSINTQDSLPLGYIWIGATGDVQTAYRLNTGNFQTYTASDGELEFNLNDEITFGAYSFTWDGFTGSKIQTRVETSEAPQGAPIATKIDSFSTAYRSAKFFVQVSTIGTGIDVNHQVTELLVIHDGTDAALVDYGTATTAAYRMGDFSASVDTVDSEVDIFFTKYASVSSRVEIKVVRTAVLA